MNTKVAQQETPGCISKRNAPTRNDIEDVTIAPVQLQT
jgi:hypothetical protein